MKAKGKRPLPLHRHPGFTEARHTSYNKNRLAAAWTGHDCFLSQTARYTDLERRRKGGNIKESTYHTQSAQSVPSASGRTVRLGLSQGRADRRPALAAGDPCGISRHRYAGRQDREKISHDQRPGKNPGSHRGQGDPGGADPVSVI